MRVRRSKKRKKKLKRKRMGMLRKLKMHEKMKINDRCLNLFYFNRNMIKRCS